MPKMTTITDRSSIELLVSRGSPTAVRFWYRMLRDPLWKTRCPRGSQWWISETTLFVVLSVPRGCFSFRQSDFPRSSHLC